MDGIFRALRALIVVPAFCTASLNAAAASIPLASFSDEPQLRSPRISPDGTKIVFITAVDNKPVVAVKDLKTHGDHGLFAAASRDFRAAGCWFKNDERILCSFRGVKQDVYGPTPVSRLVAVNADGTKQKVLIQNRFESAAAQYQDRIIHMLPKDRTHVLIELSGDTEIFPSVYKLNVYTGSLSIVQGSKAPVSRAAVRMHLGKRSRNSNASKTTSRRLDTAPCRALC